MIHLPIQGNESDAQQWHSYISISKEWHELAQHVAVRPGLSPEAGDGERKDHGAE